MKARYMGSVLLVVGFFAGFLVAPGFRKVVPAKGGNEALVDGGSGARRSERARSVGETGSGEPIGPLLDKAFSEASEIRGTRHLMQALSQHRKETAPAFAAYFTAKPFQKSHFNHWRLFFSSWGTFDGPGALAFIRKRFDQTALQQEFYYSVLKSWDHEMPDEALSGAREFLVATPGAVGDLATEFVRELMAKNPEKGILEMVRLSDPEAVMEMAGEQLLSEARRDARAALARLGGVTGDAKPYLTGRILSAWSEADPAGAANWLSQQGYPAISPGDLGAIAANYAKANATAAFGWINSLPDHLFSEQLLAITTAAWTKNDPAGAMAWLEGHQPASEYDPAVVALARTIAGENPAGALKAVDSKIHDKARGQEAFYSIAMDWKEREPEEFARWLQDTRLLESEEKARLRVREFQGDALAKPAVTSEVPAVTDDGRQ